MVDFNNGVKLYETIQLFCALKKESINSMCKKAKVSPGILTDLKMGRKSTIQLDTIARIADALQITVTALQENRVYFSTWTAEDFTLWHGYATDEERKAMILDRGVDKSLLASKKGYDFVHWLVMEAEKKEQPPVVIEELPYSKQKLIEFARSVPEDKADMILRVLQTIVESD